MKTCAKCGEDKPLDGFYRRSKSPDGLHRWCIPCHRDYTREWRAKNPAAVRAYKKKWEAAHPEEVKAAKRRRYAETKERDREKRKVYMQANRDRYLAHNRRNYRKRKADGRVRAYRLRVDYGITVEQYDAMLAEQGNACPICTRSFEDERVRPVVDHCHDTGRVRGILCNGCNLHLGWTEQFTQAIAAYLK